MPKTDPRDDRSTKASQEDLKLEDGHRIIYHSVGDHKLPLMLFVVGSSGLGSLYRNLAAEVSTTFRCIYYDKRGFLPRGSPRDTVTKEVNRFVPVSQNADDAAALIKHISPRKPVFVFGTSTGATTVLDLATRYPEMVDAAILHEPITFSVMPRSTLKNDILALYRSLSSFEDQPQGSKVYADFMFQPHSDETASALREALERQSRNPGRLRIGASSKPLVTSAEAFNARQGEQEGDAMLAYEVDLERARRIEEKLVLIRGSESKEWPISQPAVALAEALGGSKSIPELIGDHLSFAARRNLAVFAGQLVDVLRRRERHISGTEETGQKSRL